MPARVVTERFRLRSLARGWRWASTASTLLLAAGLLEQMCTALGHDAAVLAPLSTAGFLLWSAWLLAPGLRLLCRPAPGLLAAAPTPAPAQVPTRASTLLRLAWPAIVQPLRGLEYAGLINDACACSLPADWRTSSSVILTLAELHAGRSVR